MISQPRFTHILDTSAWIVHLRREPGNEIVAAVLTDPDHVVGLSALSLVELHARLRSFGRERDMDALLEDYRPLFAAILPIDETVALRATALREAASARVPAIDALIAATAAVHDAVLVHRDPHFTAIPVEQVRQIILAEPE